MAKYKMFVKACISITDVEMVVNYCNQGWVFCENDKYCSGMVTISNTFDLEIEPDLIPAYAEAFGDMTGYELCYIFSEDSDGRYWHKEWEFV